MGDLESTRLVRNVETSTIRTTNESGKPNAAGAKQHKGMGEIFIAESKEDVDVLIEEEIARMN